MLTNNYQNWQVNADADQIAWLTLSKKDESVNSLDASILNELEQILIEVDQAKELKAVVIQSGKTSGFIAGADIEKFTQLKTSDEAFKLIRHGQQVFNKLAALTIPSIALIDGFCLGGGLELALACRYRIVEDGRSKLGLPEVMLGIYPGWGGCVRLPKLIGAVAAMGLILTGRTVSAKAAKAMGFVDAVVPRRYLVKAAKDYALNPRKPKHGNWLSVLSNHTAVRPLLAKLFRYQLNKKIRADHYPAPYTAVATWEKEGVDGDKVYVAEANDLASLHQDSTAQNLVRDFFLQTRLKGLGKDTQFNAKQVHVIGAGVMGANIAAWCAYKGARVTLQDKDPQIIAKALQGAFKLFQQKLKDRLKVQAVMDRLVPDVEGNGIADADVIIEAIFENLEVKQNLFQSLEEKAKPEAILATNTSSIPLDDINSVLKNPGRLVGIHFFNPVAKMMLVEVVKGDKTSDAVFNNALAFVHDLDKLPLPVKSSPGFLVNRVLMPYLMESMELLKEGYLPEEIDAAAVDFGMPMGPVQLADTVGLDVCLSVARNLTAHYGGEVPQRLIEMVTAKQLGVKTGEGFYVYKNGKPIRKKPNRTLSAAQKETLIDRMIYRMLNESAACLREGVVQDGDLLDAGMIFGTGFAPFRGGPIHYADSIGKETLLNTFQKLASQFGPRFKADAYWNTLKP
ncbi:MAG: yfcX [Gammaproteobacteria bacterium]|jgi:3-hydroxyacyl-CoA dehydrogenase/enoyl-CoA hydratase/3-hydroxybutyryl-CoA epimerase|nr:yfcX [Gammaproteobacteria bacterium]